MKFTMTRDRTISSVLGHTIFFAKDVPTHVPPEMHREVLALGASCADLDTAAELDETPAPVESVEPSDPEARRAELFAAYARMVDRDRRGDFTAGGQPHLKALTVELGWKIADKERDLTWVEFLSNGKAE